jgi:PhzF family phenazine biosynthesis protein
MIQRNPFSSKTASKLVRHVSGSLLRSLEWSTSCFIYRGEIVKIPIYQVDAFTDTVFWGNPAVVCLLESWLPDDLMQKIALENAVPETAFLIPVKDDYDIRWFTPDIEMDLCGHATLASAHVIARHLDTSRREIIFHSKSGLLIVQLEGDLITLDFPSRVPIPSELPEIISQAFAEQPKEVLKSRDYMLVFENEEIIQNMKPNQTILNQINLDPGGIIITAPGKEVDFVSRFFTPQASIFEDPVTGSAHCSLAPYWSKRLGKKRMIALQLSSRGGKLFCKYFGDRVLISGKAVTYMEGLISI